MVFLLHDACYAPVVSAQENLQAVEQMQRLDEVMATAGSLENFLSNPTLRDQYFSELQIYYGADKFSREAYDAILSQLEKAIGKVPGLSERLWETTNLGVRTEVQTSVQTSGRSLEPTEWRTYYTAWRDKIKQDLLPFSTLSDDEIQKRILAHQSRYQQELKFAEESASSIQSKSKREEAMAEFFKRERALPETKLIAAFFLNEYLSQDLNEDAFRSGDADIILSAFDNLRQNLKSSIRLPDDLIELPSTVLSRVRDYLPTKNELLSNETIFPIITRTARDGKEVPVGSGGLQKYTFDPIPRRIHGIWKGIPIGECVGGGDLAYLSPERWGTVALAETQLLNVHQGFSNLGFIQIVPIEYQTKIFGSVDFGAGVLARKAINKNKQGERKGTTLFELWYESYQPTRPSKWRGLVVSDSNAIDNASVLSTVRDSPRYKIGTLIGKSRSFKLTDPMAPFIIKAAGKKNDLAYSYGGRMIFDGMVKDAKDMTRLVSTDPELLKNSRKLVAGLRNGKPVYQKKLLLLLKDREPSRPPDEVLSEIFPFLSSSDQEISGSAESLVSNTIRWNPELFQTKMLEILQHGKKREQISALNFLRRQSNLSFPKIRLEVESRLQNKDPLMSAYARESIVNNKEWSSEIAEQKVSLIDSMVLSVRNSEPSTLAKQFVEHKLFPVRMTERVFELMENHPEFFSSETALYLKVAPLSVEQILILRKIAVQVSQAASAYASSILQTVDPDLEDIRSILKERWKNLAPDVAKQCKEAQNYLSRFGSDETLDQWIIVSASEQFATADQNTSRTTDQVLDLLTSQISRPRLKAFAFFQFQNTQKYVIKNKLIETLTSLDLSPNEASLLLQDDLIWRMPGPLKKAISEIAHPSTELVNLVFKQYLRGIQSGSHQVELMGQVIQSLKDQEKQQLVGLLREVFQSENSNPLTRLSGSDVGRIFGILGNPGLKIPADLQKTSLEAVSKGSIGAWIYSALPNYDLKNSETSRSIQELYVKNFIPMRTELGKLIPHLGVLTEEFKMKLRSYIEENKKNRGDQAAINELEALLAYPCDAVIAGRS